MQGRVLLQLLRCSYVVASRLYDSAKISLIFNFWTFAQAIIITDTV